MNYTFKQVLQAPVVGKFIIAETTYKSGRMKH